MIVNQYNKFYVNLQGLPDIGVKANELNSVNRDDTVNQNIWQLIKISVLTIRCYTKKFNIFILKGFSWGLWEKMKNPRLSS